MVKLFWQQVKKILKHKAGFVGIVLISILVFVAVFCQWISPVDPYQQNYQLKFLPPVWQDGGQYPFLLGTDLLGRDQFSRILLGARLSLFIGGLSVLIGALIGIPIGLFSGFYGGKTDQILMRAVDIMLAFPSMLLAICIVAILGPSLVNAVIAIGIVGIPGFARVVRSAVISEVQKDYVTSDLVLGQSRTKTMFSSVLRNILSPILVIASLSFGNAVLDAAGLSFLGLGAQPPSPEWGALITEGKQSVFQAPWLILFPGLAILMTVVGFNLLGDALRDLFDPRHSQD